MKKKPKIKIVRLDSILYVAGSYENNPEGGSLFVRQNGADIYFKIPLDLYDDTAMLIFSNSLMRGKPRSGLANSLIKKMGIDILKIIILEKNQKKSVLMFFGDGNGNKFRIRTSVSDAIILCAGIPTPSDGIFITKSLLEAHRLVEERPPEEEEVVIRFDHTIDREAQRNI